MDGRQRQPGATRDIAGRAETLVQSLHGVRAARIHASDAGIDAIHVTARDAETARHMASHVRSALLAGLATPVLPSRIHVRVASEPAPELPNDEPNGATAPDRSDDDVPTPRHRIRILNDDPVTPSADTGPPAGTGPSTGSDRTRHREPAGRTTEKVDSATAATGTTAPAVARPRLISAESDRPGDGRVVCRVAIAYRTHVCRAEAIAVDLPGAAAQAAAQAAVRALLDAGIPGLELNGLREVEIAGRDYVVVALRQYDVYTRTRSGSAPIIGSPERSAAEATVAAANAMI